MNINIYKTKEELSDNLSDYIIKNHMNSSIAISGGSSPKILFKTLSEKDIKLKKRKSVYLENSRYYVEDIRKQIVENYGFDKVYKQGFNVKTPLNIKLSDSPFTNLLYLSLAPLVTN